MAGSQNVAPGKNRGGRTTQDRWDMVYMETPNQKMITINQQCPLYLLSVKGNSEWQLRMQPVEDGAPKSRPFLIAYLTRCMFKSKCVECTITLNIRNLVGDSCLNKTLSEVHMTEGDSLVLCTAEQARSIVNREKSSLIFSCSIDSREVKEGAQTHSLQSNTSEITNEDETDNSLGTGSYSSGPVLFENNINNPESATPPEVKPNSTILQDLETLLQRQEYGDLVISAQDREMIVYKGILASRSSTFAEMFAASLDKGKGDRIEIEEMSFEVLQAMIRFIYTDHVPNVSKMAKDLFKAADKYDIKQLKEMCEEELCSDITVENAAEFLLLSVSHGGEKLKEAAVKFVRHHRKEISKTAGWKKLFRQNIALVGEILMELMNDM